MKVLLDESVPHDVRHWLSGHEVHTVAYRKWTGLKNGELLRRVDAEYDIFVTADKNFAFQQDIARTTLAVVVLPSNQVGQLEPRSDEIRKAVSACAPGRVQRIE